MKTVTPFIFFIILITLSACSGDTQAASGSPPEQTAQTPAATDGQALYVTNCSACHGPTGAGLEGLGKPLTSSQFVAGQSDEALLDFLNTGRPVSDPLNTTRMMMPAKGGNPALTDEELEAIISYIRSIQTN